jgi:hypothetical protein
MLGSYLKSIYQYIPGIVAGIGVGTEGLGLSKPQTDPLYAPYDRRHTVRGDLVPTVPGYHKLVQDFQSVSLRGNGIMLQGAMDLQKLAQFQSGGGN